MSSAPRAGKEQTGRETVPRACPAGALVWNFLGTAAEAFYLDLQDERRPALA